MRTAASTSGTKEVGDMFCFRVLRTVLAFVILACFAAGARGQTTWYVDDDASPGGDGTTWATAYDSLSTALTAAQSGDQIWVAAGTYVGNFTLALEVKLYGGFVGTETELSQRNWTVVRTAATTMLKPARATRIAAGNRARELAGRTDPESLSRRIRACGRLVDSRAALRRRVWWVS